jgi:hypothetical protein
MELNEQDREAQQALQASLAKLAEIDPQDLARTGVLGTALDFSEGIPVFERTLRLFRDLAEANLDNVPATNLNALKQTADQAQPSPDEPVAPSLDSSDESQVVGLGARVHCS